MVRETRENHQRRPGEVGSQGGILQPSQVDKTLHSEEGSAQSVASATDSDQERQGLKDHWVYNDAVNDGIPTGAGGCSGKTLAIE